MIEINKPYPREKDWKTIYRTLELYEAAVEGGREWLDATYPDGEPILTRLSGENTKNYNNRKRLTHVKNFIPYIVDKYTSAVFRNKPKRGEDPWYSDVTGTGCEADTFWMSVLREALTYGYTFVAPDATDSGYPILKNICPEAVPYHLCSETGEMIEAFILSEGEDEGWWFDSQTVVHVSIKGERIDRIISQEKNIYGVCPLIKVWPETASEAFLKPIVPALASLTNHSSLKEMEIVECTYSTHYATGVKRPDQRAGLESERNEPTLNLGTKKFIFFDNPNVSVGTLGSDPAQADSLRKEIEEDRESIFQLAGLKEDRSTVNESGLSKLIGLESFAVMTRIFSRAIEEAERKIMALVDSATGQTHPPVEYSRSVVDIPEEEGLLALRDILSLDVPLLIKKKKILAYAETYLSLSDIEKEELIRELMGYGVTSPQSA